MNASRIAPRSSLFNPGAGEVVGGIEVAERCAVPVQGLHPQALLQAADGVVAAGEGGRKAGFEGGDMP